MAAHTEPALTSACLCLQEVGKQNLFVFGVDANDVPRLREERKDFKDYDPRWTAVMKSLLSGKFGDKSFFQACSPCSTVPCLVREAAQSLPAMWLPCTRTTPGSCCGPAACQASARSRA